LQGTFGPTIAGLMHTYNTAPPSDELARAQNELNQVKDVMVHNVEQILSRGERIDLLVDKTDVMAGQATAFRRGARTVRSQMWWKNQKVLWLSVFVGVVRKLIVFVWAVLMNMWIVHFVPSGSTILRCGTEPLQLVTFALIPPCSIFLTLHLQIYFYLSNATVQSPKLNCL
jgi:hypothetical protein